jgi:hypothetical protein
LALAIDHHSSRGCQLVTAACFAETLLNREQAATNAVRICLSNKLKPQKNKPKNSNLHHS